MKPDRIFWGAGAIILLLSVGLGVQVFSLSRRLEEKDRTIRHEIGKLVRLKDLSRGVQEAEHLSGTRKKPLA